MGKGFKAAVAATLLAAGTIGATAPAEAHGEGLAIGAGLLGLGVGAAISSDHPHYVVYAPPPPGYYAPPPPPPGYYAPRRVYYGGCATGYHWSHYWHQYVPDRRCY